MLICWRRCLTTVASGDSNAGQGCLGKKHFLQRLLLSVWLSSIGWFTWRGRRALTRDRFVLDQEDAKLEDWEAGPFCVGNHVVFAWNSKQIRILFWTMHMAGFTICLSLVFFLPDWRAWQPPKFHQWDLVWPCNQVLSRGYRTKGGKGKGCRHSHPLLIFIPLSEGRWKQMPASSFEGPNSTLEGNSTWVQGSEPGSLLDFLTQHACQSAAFNHCITVENDPGEIAGEWCFLYTFPISVGPADGVDGAVEMKTLPCPSAPSVCSLIPMW